MRRACDPCRIAKTHCSLSTEDSDQKACSLCSRKSQVCTRTQYSPPRPKVKQTPKGVFLEVSERARNGDSEAQRTLHFLRAVANERGVDLSVLGVSTPNTGLDEAF